VNLINTTDENVAADLVMLPPGRTVEEFQRSFVTRTGGSTAPDWLDSVVFAGGPIALANAEAQNLLELQPGTWTVLYVGETDGKSATITVTEPTGNRPSPDIPTGVDLQFDAGMITMPDKVGNGASVWRIANLDTAVHSFALVKLPQEVSREQMQAMLSTGDTPEGFDTSESVSLGGIGLLSGGHTIWATFNLEPGFYVAVDYIPGADGKTNAELGQFALFSIDQPTE
jgi:hypothetical protein